MATWKLYRFIGWRDDAPPYYPSLYRRVPGEMVYDGRAVHMEREEIDPDTYRISGPLTLIDSRKSRSGYHYIWRDEDGLRYPMFHTELMEILMSSGITNRKISGTFKFIRRGTAIGIKRVSE